MSAQTPSWPLFLFSAKLFIEADNEAIYISAHGILPSHCGLFTIKDCHESPQYKRILPFATLTRRSTQQFTEALVSEKGDLGPRSCHAVIFFFMGTENNRQLQ